MQEKEIHLVANYRFTKASQETIEKICQEVGCTIQEVGKFLRNYAGKYVSELQVLEGHNIVPSVLRNAFATLLSGTDVTPTFKANYLGLGSGSTAPANTDVKLVSETIRGEFSNRYSVDNVAFFDKFWSSAEVGGLTVTEAGVFVDATAAADSGFLLSRILMNETMTATETLTVNVSITIA